MKDLVFAALIAVAPNQYGAAPVGQYVKGELAIRAVKLAAPTVPQTARESSEASSRLGFLTWKIFDMNQDGVLNFDEYLEYSFATYLLFNEKRDGKLLYDEFKQYWLGPKNHPYTIPYPSEETVRTRFEELDQGWKGYLEIDDLRAEALYYFQVNDLNKDGLVTQAEMSEVARGGRSR